MPQIFQVLKCFKCSVFQVHQAKKSNKWQCKLCGEKQSIKRHYGLGTGKECRLHVQKLNSVRGEVNEMNETATLNESSDEELSEKIETNVHDIKDNLKSKWSEFVDIKTVEVPEPEEPQCFGNAEVVLEIPTKRRKFTKPQAKKSVIAIDNNARRTDLCSIQQSYESPLNNTENSLRIDKKNIQSNEVSRQTEFKPKTKPNVETFVPHKIDKGSKWAQFADELDEEHNIDDDDISPHCSLSATNYADSPKADERLNTLKSNDKEPDQNIVFGADEDVPKNIFSLCDENEIDDVLDI